MQVYLVTVIAYDGFLEDIGVFSTEKKARETGDKDIAERNSQSYSVREFEVDKHDPVRNP